jgi:hypothetical protein
MPCAGLRQRERTVAANPSFLLTGRIEKHGW